MIREDVIPIQEDLVGAGKRGVVVEVPRGERLGTQCVLMFVGGIDDVVHEGAVGSAEGCPSDARLDGRAQRLVGRR